MRFFIFIIYLLMSHFHLFASSINKEEESIPLSAQLLSEYIKIRSLTGNEKIAGVYLHKLFTQYGLHTEVLTDADDAYNIVGSLYPLSSGKPNVILLSHMDVVTANDTHLFKYPPFEGIIAEGNVWGRGAIDNKGMTIMQMLATIQFLEKAQSMDLPYNVSLVVVSGEETGGANGAKIVTEQFFEKLNPVVAFGEGGSGMEGLIKRHPDQKIFAIGVASKRPLWLELSLNTTSSGHSSVPPQNYPLEQKVVALEKIIAFNKNRKLKFSKTTNRMFKEIGKLEGGLRGLMLKNLSTMAPIAKGYLKKNEIVYSVLSNTVTITAINTTNGTINVIPNETKAILDCRLLPGVTTEAFIEDLKKQLNNENISIKILKEGPAAGETSPDRFYEYTKAAIGKVYPDAAVISLLFPASDDNNYFRAKGVPVYGIMPTFLSREQLESIHSIDERIPISCLEKGTQVYVHILEAIFQN